MQVLFASLLSSNPIYAGPQLEEAVAPAESSETSARVGVPHSDGPSRDHVLIRALIEQETAKTGLPSDVAEAVVFVESNYNSSVVGRVGEIGLMQVRPETAAMLGFRGSLPELAKPEVNIHYGVTYLSQAWRLAGGDLCRAAARGCGCACADEGAVNVMAWLGACSRWAARLQRKIWARCAQPKRKAGVGALTFSAQLFLAGFVIDNSKKAKSLDSDRHLNESEIFLVASKPSLCASRASANRRPSPSPGATRDRKSFGKRHGLACCSWADVDEATNLRNRNPALTLLPGHQG